MKTYHNASGTKRIFYNPHIRSWTLQNIDKDGNQIGDADFCHNRQTAFAWLNV